MGGEGSGGHDNSGPLKLDLERARVIVTCRNVKCQVTLAVGAPTHQITVNPSGVNVEPEFYCECGLVMRVHRDEVMAIGWQRRKTVGSSVIVMPSEDDRVRPAVRIERPRAVEFVSPPEVDVEVPEEVKAPGEEIIDPWGGIDIFAPLEDKRGRQDGKGSPK